MKIKQGFQMLKLSFGYQNYVSLCLAYVLVKHGNTNDLLNTTLIINKFIYNSYIIILNSIF